MRWIRKRIENELEKGVDGVLVQIGSTIQRKMEEYRSLLVYTDERDSLVKEIEKLKIDKNRRLEEFSAKEREIEHKIGLERKRQEMEVGLAKREAVLAAQESNLKNEREQFEKNMSFMLGRFEKEVAYQRELSEKLLEAMPKMNIKQKIKS